MSDQISAKPKATVLIGPSGKPRLFLDEDEFPWLIEYFEPMATFGKLYLKIEIPVSDVEYKVTS